MPIDENILQRIQTQNPILTEVNLKYQNLTIEDIKNLVSILIVNPYVTQLDLTGNLLGDACIELVVQCPFLRSLNLAGNMITDKALFHFVKNATLLSLNLSYNNITDGGIECLAANETLTSLVLNGNRIVTADRLAVNTRLTSLSLMNNEVNAAEDVQGFIHNTTLKKLFLDDNMLRDEGAILLAQNMVLEELSLNYNQLTDKSAIAFSNTSNSRLATLSLAYNLIRDTGAAAFKNVTQIKKLNLAGNQINNTGISALVQNSSITWLDLSYNQVDDATLSNFPKNTVLTHLNLGYNQLTAKGVSFLVQMPQLTFLLLSYNNVGDEGAALLANSPLTYLDLTGNNIGFEGASTLAENTSITTLILGTNHIGDPGAMLLAHNQTLRELMLCYNNISNAGAMMLAKNQTLKDLNLNYNQIDHKGKAALESNAHFTSLHLFLEPAPEYTTDRLQLIFTFTQNLFCILGIDGKIHFCNPALVRLLGYQDNELLGSNLLDLLHPEDRLENHPLARLSQKFPAINLDDRFLCKDGSYRIIRWNSQLRGKYIYSACTDITEQKKTEREYLRLQRQREFALIRQEEAENYSRQQTEFIAHLSHEIRNPLSGAYSTTEFLEEHLQAARAAFNVHNIESTNKELNILADYLVDLKKCIKYSEDILNDNLDIAKISEKRLILEEKPLSFNETVLDAIKIVQAKAVQKGLSLQISKLQSGDVLVKGDVSRIKQIIINLVSNSIKFTEKGEIKVTLNIVKNTESTTEFEIKITDTGIGMTEQEIGRLFNRFSQASATIGTQYGGTGLGLYISKKLAGLMGGDIRVESRKGQGTTFVCRISCKNLSPEEKLIKTPEISPPILFSYEQQTKPKILVAEDNSFNRHILCNLLQKEFICIEAKNGQEVVEQFDKQPLDLILMDLVMPVMSGIEATRAIRIKESERNLSRIPIIALTANALERDEIKAKEAGVDAYLVKPYKKDELISTIYSFIKQLHVVQPEKKRKLEEPTIIVYGHAPVCKGKF